MLLIDHKQHKKTYNKRLNREKDNRKKHRPSGLTRSFPLPRLNTEENKQEKHRHGTRSSSLPNLLERKLQSTPNVQIPKRIFLY
jgi:hypothetical protein